MQYQFANRLNDQDHAYITYITSQIQGHRCRCLGEEQPETHCLKCIIERLLKIIERIDVNKMNLPLAPCPRGHAIAEREYMRCFLGGGVAVTCVQCGWTGPILATCHEAIHAWNERHAPKQ